MGARRDRHLWEDVDEELRAHIGLAAAYHVASGMHEDEAWEAARARFGPLGRIRRTVLDGYASPLPGAIRGLIAVLAVILSVAGLIGSVGMAQGLFLRTPPDLRRSRSLGVHLAHGFGGHGESVVLRRL